MTTDGASVACGSKVAWPVGEEWTSVPCSLPMNHPAPRDHQGEVRGYARGQQHPTTVLVCWTRPDDTSASSEEQS